MKLFAAIAMTSALLWTGIAVGQTDVPLVQTPTVVGSCAGANEGEATVRPPG